jgi:hypothetical protein
MAHLEGAYEQISARLGSVDGRLGRVEDRLGRLEDKLDARVDTFRDELLARMDRQFYWILTLVVVSILLPLLLRSVGP